MCDQREEIKILYRNGIIFINIVVVMFRSCTWSTGIYNISHEIYYFIQDTCTLPIANWMDNALDLLDV